LQRFLSETGVSLARLAAYLRVAQSYLEAAAMGREHLTARDQAACRLLWRRLTQAVQLELPFAESPETFTQRHARLLARGRSRAPKTVAKRQPLPAGDPQEPATKPSRKSAGRRPVAKRPPRRAGTAQSRDARRARR